MRQCPLCQQIYNDDTNFCLTDGATLAPVSGSYTSEAEMPTIVREAAPTVYSPAQTQSGYGQNQPPSFSGAPFIPPVSSAPTEKSNTLLIAALVGLLALVVGGAVVGAVMYGVFKTDNKNVAGNTNSADKTNKSPSPEKTTDEMDERAEKLKQDQEKLDRDKQKLEEERRALEEQKKKSQPTPPPTRSATTAVIIDPPSNIRAAPNGTVICVARTRGTIVNILGSTGVYDNNGVWYYTDYCGRQGVIHSSQIRF